MVNLNARNEVWRLYGDSVDSDISYGNFIVQLVWKLSGVFMEKTW